jgi:hypothetical protein
MTSLKSIQIKRAENLHASASRSWLISYVNGEKPLDGHLRKAIADYTEAAKIWTDVAYPSLAQLYMAVDGTRAGLEERMWNIHLSSSVQGQNDGAGQVRAA